MIYSMTAFARTSTEITEASIICEMRSVNHRYLDINVALPDALKLFEMPIRDIIKKSIHRGKIDCYIRYQKNTSDTSQLVQMNQPYIKALSDAAQAITSTLQDPAAVNPMDILRFPGVLETLELNVKSLQAPLFELIKKAVEELCNMRGREGDQLQTLFSERLAHMRKELAFVKKRLPINLKQQAERLQKRFQEAVLELDPARLEQEMVFFIQKIDIAEEIDRAETHIIEVERTLKKGGTVGRRLDFLMQELNREANTMGSKSLDSEITHAAVEMKVQIEQMREQVQNIE